MKRLHIITKPTNVADLAEIDTQEYEDRWLLKAEKREHKLMRQFRHNLAI